MRPQGIHQWRQCDGASFARNYYYDSMNFFEPKINGIFGNNGKMVGEFPIIYYTAACLYKVFGFHEFLLRLISLILFFIGLFYLYRTILFLLKDEFYSLICALLLFTSPVIIFYANNFLPDVPALSLAFIGYYYFLNYVKTCKPINLVWAALIFSLAGVLKITALIGFVAIIGVFVLSILFRRKNADENAWWKNFKHLLPFFLFPFLISLVWILYSKHYNAVNRTGYFLLTIRPLWEMSSDAIRDVLAQYRWNWSRQYFYSEFIKVIPFLVILIYLIPKRSFTMLAWFTMFLAGAALYVILFFAQFGVHDYYIICILLLPVAICVMLLYRINEWKPQWYSSPILRLTVLIFFGVCVYHGQYRTHERLNAPEDELQFFNMMDIEPYLNKIGVDINSRVISMGDPTSGVSLYLMNRKGWAQMSFTPFEPRDIVFFKKRGAKFLIAQTTWKPTAEKLKEYEPFMKNKIGEYKGASIYALTP
ncbi:MAG: hypothetical protein JWO06_2269 [Bacteroidota bacterium]|nr:hypothetical protein [Bacteroidota bacterium]